MDLTDALQITSETPDTIKTRLLTDTNAGVDPSDPSYADTTVGGFWDDLNGAMSLELDRVYDRFNEVAAAAIPGLSFGAFLDAWATSLGIDRNDAAFAGGVVRFTGPDGTVIAAGTQVSTPQTSSDEDEVDYTVTTGGTVASGHVDLDVQAVDAGSQGNVPANSVTILDTEIDGVSVTNPAAMTGGADVETDEALQKRIVRKLTGAGGAGNADFYINAALDKPGVGFATVQPNTPSIGHATVVITDVNNDPAPGGLVDSLQADLDPSGSAAQGAGLAPIGATVIVSTPTGIAVAVAAALTLAAGYSLDGDPGTFAVRDAVTASVARYVNGLPPGGDVLKNRVIAAIVDTLGVVDVNASTLTINSVSADLAVGSTQVPSLTTPLTLT